MKSVLLIIGSIIFSALMYCVPILLVCSFVLKWDAFFQYLLTIFAIVQFCFLVAAIYYCGSIESEEYR